MICDGGSDWAHANSARVISEDTSHTDPRFAPGNIIMSYRALNKIIVIDRQTGAIVWQTNDLTVGQHDAYMIEDGFTGANNILVFDNGFTGPYVVPMNSSSRVVIILFASWRECMEAPRMPVTSKVRSAGYGASP